MFDNDFLKDKQDFQKWVKKNYKQSMQFNEPEDYPCYIFDINSDMDILTYIYKKDLELLNKLLQKSFLKILPNPLLRFSK